MGTDSERDAVKAWLESGDTWNRNRDRDLVGMPTCLNDGRRLWLGWNRVNQWLTQRDAQLKCTADESKRVYVDPSEYDDDHYISDVLSYAHAGKVYIPGIVVSGAVDQWNVPAKWNEKQVAWTTQALCYEHEHGAIVRYRLSRQPMQFVRQDGQLSWGYALQLDNLPDVKCVLAKYDTWSGWHVIELGTMRSFGQPSQKRDQAIASAWECVVERGADIVRDAIRSVRDVHNPRYALPVVALAIVR